MRLSRQHEVSSASVIFEFYCLKCYICCRKMVQVRPSFGFLRFHGGKWPSYRGTRAGRQVKEREVYRHRHIAVISPRSANHGPYRLKSSHKYCNNANLLAIPPTPSKAEPAKSSKLFMPSFFLSNVMSLAPKIDEVGVKSSIMQISTLYA